MESELRNHLCSRRGCCQPISDNAAWAIGSAIFMATPEIDDREAECADSSHDSCSDGSQSDAVEEGVRSAADELNSQVRLFSQVDCLRLQLDSLRNVWVLFNTLTFEQVDIPSAPIGQWSLGFNDDDVGLTTTMASATKRCGATRRCA